MTTPLENPTELLLVADDTGEIQLIRDAFEQLSIETRIHVTTGGDDALELLSRRHDRESASLPDLILLYLDLPRMDGFEFLETIQDDLKLRLVPVLVVTSSDATTDILESYELAANACLTRPTAPDEYAALAEAIVGFWFEQAALPPITP
ncbi:response regulator [Natronorubrum bangense]|uniref:Response regulator receiver protein n=2 Tax=Natronorubrum bangense TaxID=61858 RepID=L9W404_9EURY|nr:response regulator [Natronorubrum bangense]ELY44195.1 response regulator receiver protein [Natronorubrum bangense JCM 10635]QCC55685.1 response regulator [Natronorubrum bangense]